MTLPPRISSEVSARLLKDIPELRVLYQQLPDIEELLRGVYLCGYADGLTEAHLDTDSELLEWILTAGRAA